MHEIEIAFEKVIAVEPLLKAVSQHVKNKQVFGKTFLEIVEDTFNKHFISSSEKEQLLSAELCRLKVTDVDDFNEDLM